MADMQQVPPNPAAPGQPVETPPNPAAPPVPPVAENEEGEETDEEKAKKKAAEAAGGNTGGDAMAAVNASIEAMKTMMTKLVDALLETKTMENETMDPNDPNNKPREEPLLAFSLSDVDAGKVDSKPLAELIKTRANAAPAAIKGLQRSYAPALIKKLSEKAASMQFSVDGEEQPIFTMTELVGLLSETAVPNMLETQFSTDGEEHPDPSFLTGDGTGDAMTAAGADAFVEKNLPHLATAK